MKQAARNKLPGKLPLAELERMRLHGYQPRNKFGNRKTICPLTGQQFDSMGEYRRWRELVSLQHAGRITHLRRQVPFILEVNGMLICKYYADFVYTDTELEVEIVEDFKGHKTDVYQLKKKLMKAIHGIVIYESHQPKRAARHRRRK